MIQLHEYKGSTVFLRYFQSLLSIVNTPSHFEHVLKITQITAHIMYVYKYAFKNFSHNCSLDCFLSIQNHSPYNFSNSSTNKLLFESILCHPTKLKICRGQS